MRGLFFFNIIWIDYTVTLCPHFSPFAHLHPAFAPLPPGHHHTVVCVYGLCLYVLWLIPSPSFIQLPPPRWQLSVRSMYQGRGWLPVEANFEVRGLELLVLSPNFQRGERGLRSTSHQWPMTRSIITSKETFNKTQKDRWKETCLGVVNTQYTIQMMYRTVHLKPM